MRKILLIAGAAVALIGAAPAADSAPTFAEAMSICKMTFLDSPDRGKAMFDGLKSDDAKRGVAILCLAYRQGALDVIEASGHKPEVTS